MTLKSDVKFSKIFTLIGSFCAKYMFELKKYRCVIFMALKSGAKFEKKLICGLENNMINLAHFRQSTQKSQNWDLNGILLSKVKNI